MTTIEGVSMHTKFRRAGVPLAATALAVLGGCAATTHLEAVKPGTTLALHGVTQMTLPQDRDLASKATGQYEFVATAPSGQSMYGILPLHVSGGKMAGSILFFAPALFIGGFRDVMPFYQFDPDANELRYRSSETEEWHLYKSPKVEAEAERAKTFFAAHGTCGDSAAAPAPAASGAAAGAPCVQPKPLDTAAK
jgi:hypothetical protein